MKYLPYTEQEDNLICTFVRLYNDINNINYGLKRAAHMLNRTINSVRYRYYSVLRNERTVFSISIGNTIIPNAARITESVINQHLNVEEYEKCIRETTQT